MVKQVAIPAKQSKAGVKLCEAGAEWVRAWLRGRVESGCEARCEASVKRVQMSTECEAGVKLVKQGEPGV